MLIDNSQISRTSLKNKVAVVTGVGQGIGRETASIYALLDVPVSLVALGLVLVVGRCYFKKQNLYTYKELDESMRQPEPVMKTGRA